MKKHITLALGLVVLSGSAFASKARLEALGEDATGSQFLSDNRNVFLNAAHVNYHKDLVTFEWGNTATVTDSTQTPRSEGGAFKSSGNMVYGLYFGNESNTSNQLRAAAGATVLEQNNVDFFVGGDAGVQWGANLTYSNSKDDATDSKQNAMRANLGIISGDIEGFANIGLANKAELGAAEFDGKTSYDVGATYHMSDIALMARMQSIQAENAAGDEYKVSRNRVGVAKTYKLNDKANLWANAWYRMENSESFAGVESKSTFLPMGFALEVMTKDWLALRASVTQDVLISEDEADNGDKSTRADTTTVRAGASLLFGDLTIDGMIGNNDSTGVADDDTATANGTLRSDTLMSRVSMTYRF